MKTVQALKTKVVIELEPRKTKSDGGIFIPEVAMKANVWGKVVSAGNEVTEVQEGDKVFVTTTQGTVVRVEGKELVFLDQKQLLAKAK